MIFKKIGSILGVILLASVATQAHASGGTGTHGGDMLVSEFSGTANNIAHAISSAGTQSSCVDSSRLLAAIKDTSVYSSLAILKDGKERDAWNDSARMTIELSRSRLIGATDSMNYLTLVLHEYSGILGLESTNEFERSQSCIRELQVAGQNLESLRFRIDPLQGTIDTLVKGTSILRCEADHKIGQFWINFPRNRFSFPNKNGSVTESERSDFGVTSLSDWKASYEVETGLTTVKLHRQWSQSRYVAPDGFGDRWMMMGFELSQQNEGQFSILFIPEKANVAPFLRGVCVSDQSQ